MLILTIALVAACGSGGDGAVSEEQARELLPRMVLQDGDVPEGLQRAGEAFSTNEELAGGGIGAAPRIEQIEEWGRILGYERDFQAAGVSTGAPVIALNSAASLYETADGTSQSFADAAQQARAADWAQSYTDVTEFQVREVARQLPADEVLWLRLSGQRANSSGQGFVLVSDDQIVFRVGRVRAFLRVLISEANGTDRDLALGSVEALVRTQVQHTRDTLAAME